MEIVVASDLSARSDRALTRGVALAKDLGARLRLLHVVDEALPEELKAHSIEWARNALQREAARLHASTGVEITLDVRAGDKQSCIAEQSHGADLLVLGVHNRLAKEFAESTAGRVLKSTLAPVLLVVGDGSGPYRDVIIGVDFSMFSRAAIRQSVALAPAARLHLVHAYHVPFKGFLGSSSFTNEIAYAERLHFDAFLREEMNALGEQTRALGVMPGSLETVLREGPPIQVLRHECRRIGADLVVIATHGRAGVSRAVWGTVAGHLLNDPPTDVLVIAPYPRAGQRDGAEGQWRPHSLSAA